MSLTRPSVDGHLDSFRVLLVQITPDARLRFSSVRDPEPGRWATWQPFILVGTRQTAFQSGRPSFTLANRVCVRVRV